MSKANDLLARANSIINEESNHEDKLNMVHLVVSMRETLNKYYSDNISALRFGKLDSSKNELRLLFHYRYSPINNDIKCIITLEDDKDVEELSKELLLKLIHCMLSISNNKCAPCKEIKFKGVTFKIMIYNEGNYSIYDDIFTYVVKFVLNTIINLFDGDKVRSDLYELARNEEERSKMVKESIRKSFAERKKMLEDLPEEKRKEIEERKKERAEAYKKSAEAKKELLNSITMLFDGI